MRFPYWVQLDSTTLWHYFGLEAEIEQSFPHGFITTKLFPASFCVLSASLRRVAACPVPQGENTIPGYGAPRCGRFAGAARSRLC